MFSKGEFIMYGTAGVCLIYEIGKSPVNASDEKLYYMLKPQSGNDNSVIFIPTDNKTVKMRRLLSSEQADALINEIPGAAIITVENEKLRRDAYKQALSSCEPINFVRIIKTVYERRREAEKLKKRLPDNDIEYEKHAKQRLYGELSYVFGIPYEDTETFVVNKVREMIS